MAKSPRPTDEPTDDAVASEVETVAGKGRPTPSRREQESARKRPLVPDDRKQANRSLRDRERADRERARVGFLNGEEKYLGPRDKGPQRRFVRDYVDARWSLGELVMPLLVIVVITYILPGLLPAGVGEVVANTILLVTWGFMIIVAVEGFLVARSISKKLAERFGKDRVERGVRLYAFLRMVQTRPLRSPKPQVKRGEFPK